MIIKREVNSRDSFSSIRHYTVIVVTLPMDWNFHLDNRMVTCSAHKKNEVPMATHFSYLQN